MDSTLSRGVVLSALAGAASLLVGCAAPYDGSMKTATARAPDAVYVAHLTALNPAAAGSATTGEARFESNGDNLLISVNVRGAPAGIVHWQHFHGFKDGHDASCATARDDANGDGIVDLIETGKASGTTMVPFDNAPAQMDVAHGTYPTAGSDGSYSYRQTVSMKDLSAAFGKAFGGPLLLERRVVYIHGVPSHTKLPSSVASLGPIPASTTLPIACGKIVRVR